MNFDIPDSQLPQDLATLAADPRILVRREGAPRKDGTCVVYWMQRAVRIVDNPALNVAIEAANILGLPPVIYFGVTPNYPNANLRHYHFLEQGLRDAAEDAAEREIAFVVRRAPDTLEAFLEEVGAAMLIGDENPCREPERWRQALAKKLRIPFFTVDADVIVPSRLLAKAQYAARIIRPRLKAHLDDYLVPCTNPRAKVAWGTAPPSLAADPALLDDWKQLDRSVRPVKGFTPGTTAALTQLHDFVAHRLAQYPQLQGDPAQDGSSRLSPYLHFGQLSPITVALAVQQSQAPEEAKEKYLDEIITWRELAANFVTFCPVYDSIECAEPWAHRTLAAHAADPRPILYTRKELEEARTHDELWNAAQLQMLHTGWMHNYMRMYWAKKILEWSPSPQAAYRAAVEMNDRYQLDGRDPAGYAGVAWAVAGKFDRPWFERPVFGQIRYMSGPAAAKKFNAESYIRQMKTLAEE